MSKRILFLYNGGTIGLDTKIIDGKAILVAPKDGESFRQVCEPIIKKFDSSLDITFELVTTKDSTNMTPGDWKNLVLRVAKAQEEGYKGVAIAHGTDTLAYTATALALGLHGSDPRKSGLKIPVCLTGAQNPIYNEGGDGRFNLSNVFRVLNTAIENGVADVLISFWNRVVLGCRTLKVSEKKFDAMQAPAYPDVGEIDSHGVKLHTDLMKKRVYAGPELRLAPEFGNGLVSLELTPGIEPSMILSLAKNKDLTAIILKSLGEGNVCSEGKYNLLPAIKQVTQELKIPIFITTKFIGGSSGWSHYEVGYEALKAGGIACYDHTDVAVETKVRWLIGNKICSDSEGFRRAMKTSFAGEVTPQD